MEVVDAIDDPERRASRSSPARNGIDARITESGRRRHDQGSSVGGAKRSDSTVRLLGINTPETVDPNAPVECGGPEATVVHAWAFWSLPVDT